MITGAPGRTSWVSAMPPSASARVWAHTAAAVTGDIAPARTNGVTSTAWFAAAYTRSAPSIVRVPHQRAVRVDQAGDHRVVSRYASPNRMRAIVTVSRARSGCVTEPMNGLSLIAHVGIDHVEVPLVHGHVDRLADRAAAVVEVRRQIGQLHEVAEVLDRAVAAAAVEVAHEGRAVVRREDGVRIADPDAPLGVPCVLGEHARRGGLDDLAAHPAREADALALDVGTGILEQAQRLGVAPELEPDLLEDRVGVVLDQREPFLVEDLERLERARQERHALDVGRGARGEPAPPDHRCDGVARCRSSVLLGGPDGRLTCGLVAGGPAARVLASTGRCRGRAVGQRDDAREMSDSARSRAGRPWRRRNAPGTGARPRSRSSHPRATSLDLPRAPRRTAARSAHRSRPRCRPTTRSPGRSRGRAPAPSRAAGRSGCRTRPRAGPVERLDAGVIHQQPHAGVERRLRELDRPHVVLGDRSSRRLAVVQDVARTSGRRRRRAATAPAAAPSIDPVGGDDAGQEQLGDDLDDARAADAGDADLAAASANPARRTRRRSRSP